MTIGALGIILAGFIAAPFAPLIFRRLRGIAPWLVSAVPFALFASLCTWIEPVRTMHSIVESRPWIPGLDIRLSFLVDGLSLLFALLITGIGGLVFFYSKNYLENDPHIGRFYGFLLLFMGSMLGLVLAGNLISLYVFWELTTISSFLLIGFHHREPETRRAAVQALVVTNIGGLAMLAGLILLGQAGGSYELIDLLSRGEAIRENPFYVPIMLLLLFGAFTKSAQVPFHFWLPNAMAAPTPVSAYLHSATMVKGGVYLIARMLPVLGGTDLWIILISVVGGISLVTGGCMAMVQTDIKRMLAYSTISVLGLLIMLLGVGTEEAVKAALVYLFAHALYKATLFLCAGAIDHETGTRDLTRMGGLGRVMPLVAVGGVAAAFSKSGLPPSIGFIGKEFVFKTVWDFKGGMLLVAGSLIGSMFLVAVGWIAGIRPFFGKTKTTPESPHRVPFAMWLGPFVLGVSGILTSLFPDSIRNPLLKPAMEAVSAHSVKLEIALWHGFTPALALSAAAIAGGALLYLGRRKIRQATSRFGLTTGLAPDRLYDLVMKCIARYAEVQTRILQTGYLRQYLMVIFGFTVGLVLYRLMRLGGIEMQAPEWNVIHFFATALSILILAATVVVLRSPSMLAAIIALGVVGYSQALFFVLFSAPDVALTQILVETVTLILFVLIIYRLPGLKRISKPLSRGVDAVVSIALGIVMTLLTLKAVAVRIGSEISGYFANNSYPLAHGRNIVNVILVDFRSLDTMGEITVLAITAMGVFTLMKLRMSDKGD